MTLPATEMMTLPRRAQRALLKGFCLIATGAMLCAYYGSGVSLPPKVSAGAIGLIALWAVSGGLFAKPALLPRFMLLLYALPFSGFIAYVLLKDFMWWEAPAAVSLVLDPAVTADMAQTGLVGILGLCAGCCLGEWPAPIPAPRDTGNPRLSSATYLVLLAAAVLVPWTSARGAASREEYFTDALEAATATGVGGSIFLVSYSLLVVLGIDALRETLPTLKRLKVIALLVGVTYVVVVLQLLRGDRESLGLLVALGALYVSHRPDEETDVAQAVNRRIRGLLPVAVGTLCAFLAVGQLRYAGGGTAGGVSALTAVSGEVVSGGTWTAVLLGNLGLSGEHVGGGMAFLNGKTYVDYLLSLPPGFVTRSLGIVRPLESLNGPGLWYYPLQWGGVHPVVVPFKNFGPFGVLLVLGMFGFVIARREYWSRLTTFWPRLWYASFFLGSFSWFWYGDMPFIRTLMAAGLVGGAVRLWLYLTRNPLAATASFDTVARP